MFTLKQLKDDPRTVSRSALALISCIENNKTSKAEIFQAVEKSYSIGRHRSPSYIKLQKLKAIELLKKIDG
jgi:hypothetical protein